MEQADKLRELAGRMFTPRRELLELADAIAVLEHEHDHCLRYPDKAIAHIISDRDKAMQTVTELQKKCLELKAQRDYTQKLYEREMVDEILAKHTST